MATRYMQCTAIMCLALAAGGMTSCGDGSRASVGTPAQEAAAITAVQPTPTVAPTAVPPVTAQPSPSPTVPSTTVPPTELPTTTATAAPTNHTSTAAAHPVAPRGRVPSTRPGSANPAAAAAVQRASEDLAQQLGIDANTIELLSVTRRFKPTGVSDTPGRMIGWDIRLAVADQVYRYYVDTSGGLHRR